MELNDEQRARAEKALDALNAKLKADGKTLQEAEYDYKTEQLAKMKDNPVQGVWNAK